MTGRGFSLTELLVVMGILAILVAASFANYARIRQQGLEVAAQSHGASVIQALQGYLALYLSDSPSALITGQLRNLPPPNYSGAPASMPRPPAGRNCTEAYTLQAPTGSLTPYSWPNANPRIGCVLSLDGIGRFVVYTWVRGGRYYYANGSRP